MALQMWQEMEAKGERRKDEEGEAVVLSRRWMSSVGVTIVVCAAAATLQLNLQQKAQSIWVIFVFKCRRAEA